MNYTEHFLELVKANPDARIVPIVDTDVVADDSYSNWYASFGDCYLDEMCMPEDMERVYFKSDIDTLQEDYFDKYDDGTLSEDEYDMDFAKYADGLTWEKVIVVKIEAWDL